ncbi:MAG: NAD(P)/FAD-dependent oxidoreductase [Dehalococcoidia bacterium]|nr:NAD(P)/FAD-dependent oxidoreductase [Dehalococcoidia bacterium]
MKTKKYDVAIIGSGLGGLAAAGYLGKAGYQVLVVERLPFLGGRCANTHFQGFTLPSGVVWVSDGFHGQLCRDLGASFEIRVPKPEYFYRIRGKDYEMPAKGGLRAMITLAAEEAEAAKAMSAVKRGMSWQEPPMSISVKDWLEQYSTNPSVLGVFEVLSTLSSGLRTFELPAGEFFRYLMAMSAVKNYGFVPGGCGHITEALSKVVKDNGGEIWLRARAKRITQKSGVVTGVLVDTADGQVEVQAKAVLSNAGPQAIVELVGQENLEKGYLGELEQKLKPSPQIIFYIASDRPLLECQGMTFLTQSRRVLFMAPLTNLCPELAPRGQHLMEAAAYLGNSAPPFDLRQEMDLALADLRENLPGFEKHSRILLAGCYYGGWPVMRCWPGNYLPQKTPIENLYNIGDGVPPAGWWGSPSAVQSARIVVEDVKRRIQPG